MKNIYLKVSVLLLSFIIWSCQNEETVSDKGYLRVNVDTLCRFPFLHSGKTQIMKESSADTFLNIYFSSLLLCYCYLKYAYRSYPLPQY